MRSYLQRVLFRRVAAATLLLMLALPGAGRAAEFSAGGFSFSDELGGFRLLSASGQGTVGDPLIVVEEIEHAAPITLVIRRRAQAFDLNRPIYAPLTLVKVVVNRSRIGWSGFEVELQEILGKPSTYGDGLSFHQIGPQPPEVSSDAFSDNNRLFEPHDRILFENGYVDPEARAQFKISITDPTPIAEFYLVQDPKLLSAGLPRRGTFASWDD